MGDQPALHSSVHLKDAAPVFDRNMPDLRGEPGMGAETKLDVLGAIHQRQGGAEITEADED